MRITSLVIAVCGATLAVRATPPADVAYNEQARAEALKLFSTGKSAAGVAYLNANLRNTQGVDGRLEVIQQLIFVAFALSNQHQSWAAASAATEAFTAAAPLVSAQERDGYRSSMLSNLGQLAEVVAHDPRAARAYYTAALIAQPSNDEAKAAVAAIDAREKGRPSK